MAETTTEQSYAKHARFDPWYHFFAVPVFAGTFFLAVADAVRNPNLRHIWMALLALAALLALFHIRIYALRVQDRVIRLEERLRIVSLGPESVRLRISEITKGQLIALRFASDGELPALAEKALDERLTGKQIKRAIQVWRPDLHRV